MKTESVTTIFERELRSLINRCSMENGSNTPDYVLACYLRKSLEAFDEAVNSRQRWRTWKEEETRNV